MDSVKYLSSDVSERLPRSVFEGVDVPQIYDKLGLEYENYILEDGGRAQTVRWLIARLSDQHDRNRSINHARGPYVVDLGCATGRPVVETIANALRALNDQRTDDSDAQNGVSKGSDGTSTSTNDSHDVSTEAMVVGVDISPVLLMHARQRITTENPIAQFEHGDIRTWSPPSPYRDGSLDAVTSFYVLNHLPVDDFRSVIQRMAGWLKPGGLLALGTVAHVNGRVRWLGYEVAATSLPLNEIVELVENAGCKVERSWEETWRSTTRTEAHGKINQFVLAVKGSFRQ